MRDSFTFLKETQGAEGGWAYSRHGAAAVEPTALVLLALDGRADATALLEPARAWLLSVQNADGGWGLNALDPLSSWHTAWALLALAGWREAASSLQRGVDWLASVPVYRETSLDVIQFYNRDLRIDISLSAWPWAPGEASWVVPSALALLSSRNYPLSAELQERLDEALHYLVDRRVPGGGWNVGNPAMFDGVLPAHTTPTALALLALHAHAPGLIQSGDLDVLRQVALSDGGAKALGWALLALRTLDEETHAFRNQLLSLQEADGSWEGSPHTTAIALLGLEGAL